MHDVSETKSTPSAFISENKGTNLESQVSSTNNFFNSIVKKQKPRSTKPVNSIIETISKKNNSQLLDNHPFHILRKNIIKHKSKKNHIIDDPVDNYISNIVKPYDNSHDDCASISSPNYTQKSNLILSSSFLNNLAAKNQEAIYFGLEKIDNTHSTPSIDKILNNKLNCAKNSILFDNKANGQETLTTRKTPLNSRFKKIQNDYSLDKIFDPKSLKSEVSTNHHINEKFAEDPIVTSFKNQISDICCPVPNETSLAIQKLKIENKTFNMFDFLYNKNLKSHNKSDHMNHNSHSIISSKKRANRISSTLSDLNYEANYEAENAHVKNLIRTVRISTNSEESKKSNSRKIVAIKGGLLSHYRKLLSKNNHNLDCISSELAKLDYPLHYDPPKLHIKLNDINFKSDLSNFLNNFIKEKSHTQQDISESQYSNNFTRNLQSSLSKKLELILPKHNRNMVNIYLRNSLGKFLSEIETLHINVWLFNPIRLINNTENASIILGVVTSLNNISKSSVQISLLLLTKQNSTYKTFKTNTKITTFQDFYHLYSRPKKLNELSFLIFFYSSCYKNMIIPIISPILIIDIDTQDHFN